MDQTRWQFIQALFHEAADLSETEQNAFLEARCGDDAALKAELLGMLEEDARGTSLLDQGLPKTAQQILEASNPLPFKQCGPYRLRRLLGEGGMGIVYLADREDLGSQVAIKLLRDAWLSPARRDRFSAEQRTLAQLNHPSIARLYDADSLPDGTPWFVMEYVEGLTLTEYCARHESSIAERLQLFRQVCEAVSHAHRHAIIHRDLKPSNILVKSDGSLRLLDFGIAKQLESLDLRLDETRTGLRLMTPAYAAPEQIRGERVGVHTDVYALGVILYELLTGQLPFDLSDRTPAEAELLIIEVDPERPSALLRHGRGKNEGGLRLLQASRTSWADLDVLCLTALHKDPQRRYGSVEALIRDIDHFLQGQPLEARRDSLVYRLGKFVRRNRRAVSAAVLAFVTIAAMATFFTLRLANARNAAVAEAARTQRIQRFMLSLFQGGDEDVGPAENLRVITLVDRGVQEARALDGEPAVQAELYQTLGSLYQKLGKFEQGDSLLSSALEQRRALFGPDHADVAESLVALGLLRVDQARMEEAEELARQGLEMSRRTVPADQPAVARAMAALGQVLEARGRYSEAIPVLEEAVRLYSARVPTSPELAIALSDLANTHFYAGHYEISESLNRRILAMDMELYGDRHPHVADDLINLGAIQLEGGHYAEAEMFYRQGLEIIRSWYGQRNTRTASALTMLGRALIPQNRLGEAGEIMREALDIQEQVFGKAHPRVASALNEIGQIAVREGRLDDAEVCFTRMADIYRTVYDDKHYYIGVALSNLAGVYQKRKEYGRAELLFREVLRRYAKTLSTDHQLVGIARVRLAVALVPQHRYAEAESQLLSGYEILMKQTSPPEAWLKVAREQLVTVYEALHQSEKAAPFRDQAGSQ